MSRSSAWLAFVLAFPVLAFAAPVPAFAADETPPSVDEQAADFVKEFKKNARKLSEGELIQGVDKLAEYYKSPEVEEKTKKDVLEGIEKACGVREATVIVHVLRTCGDLGEETLKIVLPVVSKEVDAKEPRVEVYEEGLKSLGKIHSENKLAIKILTDLLKHNEPTIVMHAIRALGGYAPASGEVRKELFEEVLKASEGTYSASQGTDQNAKRKWNVIGDDVKETLTKLSGVAIETPVQARSWFNDNKKKSWDRKDE